MTDKTISVNENISLYYFFEEWGTYPLPQQLYKTNYEIASSF